MIYLEVMGARGEGRNSVAEETLSCGKARKGTQTRMSVKTFWKQLRVSCEFGSNSSTKSKLVAGKSIIKKDWKREMKRTFHRSERERERQRKEKKIMKNFDFLHLGAIAL